MEFGAIRQESMFTTALPYGLGTLGLGVVGAITAVAATSTIGLIMGIALGILGGYGFLGVLSCAWTSRNSFEFNQNIWKHIVTAAGTGIASIIQLTIEIVIAKLVGGSIDRKWNRI